MNRKISMFSDSNGSLRVILNRICLALAAVSCRLPRAMQTYVNHAQSLLTTFDKPQDRWGLEMLSVLPDEVESIDASRSLKVELTDQMNDIMPMILNKVDDISNMVMRQQLVISDITTVMRSSIALLHAWLKFGLTLSGIYQNHRPTLVLLLLALQTRDKGCIVASCNFLTELIVIVSYPRDALRNEALQELLVQLMRCVPPLSSYLDCSAANEDVAVSVCNCFNAIVYQEAEYIIGVQSQNVDFIKVFLSLTSLKQRKLVMCTFDAWVAVGDVPVIERHSFARTELFTGLLANLFGALMYPENFSKWEWVRSDVESEDDFSAFRDYKMNGFEEVLSCCLYSLNQDFFALLTERIQQMGQGPNGFDWRVLECICFVLKLVAVVIKSSFLRNEYILSFLSSLFENILSLPVEFVSTHTQFGEQIADVMRSYTYLFVSADHNFDALFLKASQFLFNCALQSSKVVSLACSRCLLQFLNVGYLKLLNQVGTTADGHPILQASEYLYSCLHLVSSSMSSTQAIVANAESFGLLLQGLCSVITHITPVSGASGGIESNGCTPQDLIRTLGSGLLQQLQYLIQQQPIDVKVTVTVLSLIKQLIKYGNNLDLVAENDLKSVSTIYLLPFVGQLVPLLLFAQGLPDIGRYELVVEAMCGVYSELLVALSSRFCEYLSSLGEFIVKMLSYHVCRHATLLCAKQIHEMFSSESNKQLPGIASFLLLLWDSVLSVMIPPNALQLEWMQDPSIVESFLLYTHSYILLTPEIIARSPYMSAVGNVIIFCLRFSNEKASIKAVLQIIQAIFCSVNEDAAVKSELLLVGCQFGKDYLRDILSGLDGKAPAILRTNLIDALYSILLGCVTGNRTEECKYWMSSLILLPLESVTPSVMDNSQAPAATKGTIFEFWPKVSSVNKPVLLEKLFLYVYENKRKFRALMLDIAKVSTGEDTEDCLMAHFDYQS
jgi:hypothetical protein